MSQGKIIGINPLYVSAVQDGLIYLNGQSYAIEICGKASKLAAIIAHALDHKCIHDGNPIDGVSKYVHEGVNTYVLETSAYH